MTTNLKPFSEAVKTPVAQPVQNFGAGFDSLQSFELMQRGAKLLASSTLVPKEYMNNVSNCVIALNMAQRMNCDPFQIMQNLYIVHGKPSWSSQFLIACFNQCGRFSSMRFEFFGERNTDGWGCRAWAIEKSTEEKITGADITIAIAKSEGWHGRNGSKWKTMPQQMLMYRAASWFVRAYAPELSMGLQTAEETHDVYDARRGGDGSYSVDMGELKADQNTIDGHISTETGGQVNTDTGEIINSEPKKPKRSRRTKAEMEAARAADDTAKANTERQQTEPPIDDEAAALEADAMRDMPPANEYGEMDLE
jgi:hypothetical protein